MSASIMKFARLAAVAVVGCVSLSVAASAQNSGALDLLKSQPASIFSIGVINVDGSLDAIEDHMWEYTYDLSGYGDDGDQYGFLFPHINYRYGYSYVDEDTGIFFLTGVAIADGKFLEGDACQSVINEMRNALFGPTDKDTSIDDRAKAFLARMFPATLTRPGDTDALMTGLLDEVMLEVRLHEDRLTGEPDATCIGFLNRDMAPFAMADSQ
jgi:hypothetical protein